MFYKLHFNSKVSTPSNSWIITTVEPRYNNVRGNLKINLLYQVSHYIRVQKQRNIKRWDQQNYLVIRGFCYIRPLSNKVPLYLLVVFIILMFASFSFSLLCCVIGSLAIDVSTLYTSLSNEGKSLLTVIVVRGIKLWSSLLNLSKVDFADHDLAFIHAAQTDHHLLLEAPENRQPRSSYLRGWHLTLIWTPVQLGVENLTLSQTARRTQNTPCHWIP